MAITEKTRKLLWGRSGNRCAMFRCKLAIDETETNPDSIVVETSVISYLASSLGQGTIPISPPIN